MARIKQRVDNMKIKLFNNNAIIPEYKTKGSAGADLAMPERKILMPNQTYFIPLGVGFQMNKGEFGLLVPRSSSVVKKGLEFQLSPAVIDSDYIGEVHIVVRSKERVILEKGERIAQIIFQPYNQHKFNVVSNLSSTDRGDGRFGSTD